MASEVFQKYRVKNAPPWLQGPNGTAWLDSHGAIEDQVVDDAIQAVKCRMPEECPADALAAIGKERGIPRGPADSNAVYGTRLRKAWETWSLAGSPLAILLALEVQGYDSTAGNPVIVTQNGNAYTLDPDTTLEPDERLVTTKLGTNPAIGGIRPLAAGSHAWWSFDATGLDANNDQYNSRFGLIFQAPLPGTWTSIVSPPTAVSAPDIDEVNTIIRTIHQWKPSKATCMWITVADSGDGSSPVPLWGYPPDQAWGDPGLVWGGTVDPGGSAIVFNCEEYT